VSLKDKDLEARNVPQFDHACNRPEKKRGREPHFLFCDIYDLIRGMVSINIGKSRKKQNKTYYLS
jgi:hypothetical protein